MKIEFQNKLYIRNNHRLYFKKIKNEILKSFSSKEKISVLDVGCANGDLINYLDHFFDNFNYVGIEKSKVLYQRTKKRFRNNKNIKIYKSSVQNYKKKHDLVIATGVFGYFDTIELLFNKLLSFLNKKEKSQIVIFDNLNEHGVEKIVKFRVKPNANWLSGHNQTSIDKVSSFFKKKKYKISFKKFIYPGKIKKTNDPSRSYTSMIDGKKNILISKTGLIFTFYIVTITK